MRTRKLTIKYWNSLSEGSRKRALMYCFPINSEIADMLLGDKPQKDNPWWKMVFAKVRIPEPDANGYRHYKTVVNNTYIP